MVRIAQGVWPDEIQEPNYFTPQGEYRVDERASKAMKESLMYKMSYYRYAELFEGQQPQDRVRGQSLPKVGPSLDYVDEAFTSENWIVSFSFLVLFLSGTDLVLCLDLGAYL